MSTNQAVLINEVFCPQPEKGVGIFASMPVGKWLITPEQVTAYKESTDLDNRVRSIIFAVNKNRWLKEFLAENPQASLPNGFLQLETIVDIQVAYILEKLKYYSSQTSYKLSKDCADEMQWLLGLIISIVEPFKAVRWSDAQAALARPINFRATLLIELDKLVKEQVVKKARRNKQVRKIRNQAKQAAIDLARKQEQELGSLKQLETELLARVLPVDNTTKVYTREKVVQPDGSILIKRLYRKAMSCEQQDLNIERNRRLYAEIASRLAGKCPSAPELSEAIPVRKQETHMSAGLMDKVLLEDQGIANEEYLSSAPVKWDMKLLHQLVFSDKKAKQRADELGISVRTLYNIEGKIRPIKDPDYKCIVFAEIYQEKMGLTVEEGLILGAKIHPPVQPSTVSYLFSQSDKPFIPFVGRRYAGPGAPKQNHKRPIVSPKGRRIEYSDVPCYDKETGKPIMIERWFVAKLENGLLYQADDVDEDTNEVKSWKLLGNPAEYKTRTTPKLGFRVKLSVHKTRRTQSTYGGDRKVRSDNFDKEARRGFTHAVDRGVKTFEGTATKTLDKSKGTVLV